jgi:hypothetical protein
VLGAVFFPRLRNIFPGGFAQEEPATSNRRRASNQSNAGGTSSRSPNIACGQWLRHRPKELNTDSNSWRGHCQLLISSRCLINRPINLTLTIYCRQTPCHACCETIRLAFQMLPSQLNAGEVRSLTGSRPPRLSHSCHGFLRSLERMGFGIAGISLVKARSKRSPRAYKT